MVVNGETLQLHTVYILYCKSGENQALQVTFAASEHAMGSYDKIIITIVPSYTGKNITRLLPLALITRAAHL